MADLIAKVSRSSTHQIDPSGVYSHAISQLASGNHDANVQPTFPTPAKVPTKQNPYNSDVELNDIMYGKEFAPGGGGFDLEIDVKREVRVQVESVDSSDTEGEGKYGNREKEISIAATEESERPLRDGRKEVWESKYGVGVGVHTTAWSCESG
jgi:hypothetical protein